MEKHIVIRNRKLIDCEIFRLNDCYLGRSEDE